MEHIETVTLDASQSSITFSPIPQDFTDLMILVSARSDESGDDSDFLQVQLNSESNSAIGLVGVDSDQVVSLSFTDGRMGFVPSNGSTTNTFGNTSIYIPNYTSTNSKSISVDSVNENNSTRADRGIFASLSTSTAATTSITFTLQTGTNFLTGSTISLYGITAGSDGTTTVS